MPLVRLAGSDSETYTQFDSMSEHYAESISYFKAPTGHPWKNRYLELVVNFSKLIKTPDTVIIVGDIDDNFFHLHYASQITVAFGGTFEVTSDGGTYRKPSLAIKSLVPHRLNCHGQNVLLILINPGSKLGHLINHHVLKNDIEEFDNEWTRKIRNLGTAWAQDRISNASFLNQYVPVSQECFSECSTSSHTTDERILKALGILELHSDTILPLEKIASEVALSPSRFIHLFKKETGITYRRMQLWIKLMRVFEQFPNCSSLTELAHFCGFSDSAHFSRTFKETFGITPSLVVKNSQFIQG